MAPKNTPSKPTITPTLSAEPFSGQIIIQAYRDAFPGSTPKAKRDALSRAMARAKIELGHAYFMMHGFPIELASAWDGLSDLAKSHELGAMASWGLDSNGTPVEKGKAIGSVLAKSSCKAGLLDAEGAWENKPKDPNTKDNTTESTALELCSEIQRLAPNAIVGDQPWPHIDFHGDVRRTVVDLGEGGSFAGFPVDEFGIVTNWGRFRQFYWENWKQQDKYSRVENRMNDHWAKITPGLRTLGVERPLRVTIQGYAHDKEPWEFAHAVLFYGTTLDQPVVIWSDPFPTESTIAILKATNYLKAHGFATKGKPAKEIVRDFQLDYNRTCAAGNQLIVDGNLGWESMKRIGIMQPR